MQITKISTLNYRSQSPKVSQNTSFCAAKQNPENKRKKNSNTAPTIVAFALVGAIFAALLLGSKGKV